MISEWFETYRVGLKFTRTRNTKTGDFRPPRNGSLPAITVNQNLNKYACLITLVHEMAHYHVYLAYRDQGIFRRRKRVAPHGNEWKQEFRRLMEPHLTPSVFPEELLPVLGFGPQ